jgi:tetratricopeptide (TPR) repeat protein
MAAANHLRGVGYELTKDYFAAISAFREAIELLRTLDSESIDIAINLSSLASAERESGDLDSAERDYREALRISRILGNQEGVAMDTGNLAALALDRQDWPGGETLARKALLLSEKIGRQELIGSNLNRIAKSLVAQGKKAEALPYAQRAVEIFIRLNSPRLGDARGVLAECES